MNYVTLTKGTGGSFLAKAVAAFSYSGASRLPIRGNIHRNSLRETDMLNLQCPHQGA